ncbi:MAG: pentapeptide repeat-containing protein, partial [Pseudanabaena sp.]
MKTKFIAILVLLCGIWWVTPVEAYEPVQLQQLLKTRQCGGCDLTNANLAGVNLGQAHLIGASLMGANLS